MIEKLKGRNIILGVTGSIAAYKSPLLVRELVKSGANVNVIMTKASAEFVTPLVLSNLSRNPVIMEMFSKETQRGGAWHIHIAHQCDVMIIAPCSASTLAKLAAGLCDNPLVTVATAIPRTIPLLIAPAMDTTMWLHPATQRNIKILKVDGAIIIPPDEGQLSSGLEGAGRLPDVDVLINYIAEAISDVSGDVPIPPPEDSHSVKVEVIHEKKEITQEKINEAAVKSSQTLQDAVDKDKWTAELEFTNLKNKTGGQDKPLSGKKVLITAGPTYEKIDDVRFISNHSSGKMGYALAKSAKEMGAEVKLISGPVALEAPDGMEVINVESAKEMYDEAIKQFPGCDISILSAAVADFTPVKPEQGKIKKEQIQGNLTIELKRTNDILAEFGKSRKGSRFVVGFALESINEIENGWKKLKEKNCDMLVVNSATKPDSGFRGDNNTITILTRDGKAESFPPMSKKLCAEAILQNVVKIIENIKIPKT